MATIDFQKLTDWEKRVFAAALLERMWPNYLIFSQNSDFGDASQVKNQLDLIWQKSADSGFKFNLDVQLDKLEENTPEPDDFDLFAVYPALDFCTGLISLLSSFKDKQIDPAREVARLSVNSVETYLSTIGLNLEDKETQNQAFTQDPLYIWEMEMQMAIVNCIQENGETKNTCRYVKELVTESGMSNLGLTF